MTEESIKAMVSALVYLKAADSGLEFQIASIVAGAGDLGDIVFKFKPPDRATTWISCFMHLEQEPLNRSMLTDLNGNFSVGKYFRSFRQNLGKAERNGLFNGIFEDCRFIILTPSKMDLENSPNRVSMPIQQFICSGSVYHFDPNAEIDKTAYACLDKFGDEGRFFMKQFLVFFNQVWNDLDSQIEEELTKLLKSLLIPESDLYVLCSVFKEKMSSWWKDGNEVLDNSSDVVRKAWLMHLEEHSSHHFKKRNVNKSTIVGKDSIGESTFQNGGSMALRAIERCHKIVRQSEIKINPSRKITHKVNPSVDKLSTEKTLKTDFNFQSHYSITVEKLSSKESTSHFDDEKAVTSMKPRRKIHPSVEKLSTENILKTEFSFQSHMITFEKFLGPDATGQLDQLNDLVSLIDIFGSGSKKVLQVGPELVKTIPNYVNRLIERANVLSDNIFQIHTCPTDLSMTTTTIYSSIQDVWSVFIKSDPLLTPSTVEMALKKFSTNPLVLADSEYFVFIAETFTLGKYACNYVSLRSGKVDKFTALQIRPCGGDDPEAPGFLFVDKKVKQADIDKLSEFNQTKHFLRWDEGTLTWTKSLGSLDVVRKHVDETRATSLRPENLMEVDGRVVLLCAESGVGTSTFLSHLAEQTKLELPQFWIISISLKTLVKLFEQKMQLDPLKIISTAVSFSIFCEKLLKLALEGTGNVVFILDWFNGIASQYRCEYLNFLDRLLETKAKKIWIVSRNEMKTTLEDNFKILAVKLRDLDKSELRCFLQLYLEKSSIRQDDKLILVRKILDTVSQHCRDLQLEYRLQIMTEMADMAGSSKITDDSGKVDLLQMFEHILEKEIMCKEIKKSYKKMLIKAKISKRCDKVQVWSPIHARLDLVINLDAQLPEFLLIKKSGTLEGYGIVDSLILGEYFIAKLLSDHYTVNCTFLQRKYYTGAFSFVRSLFDQILAKDCELHNAVLNEDVAEVKKLLNVERFDVDARDARDRTALHLAAALGTSEDQAENERRGEILDLLISRTTDFNLKDDIFNSSPLTYAVNFKSWVAVDKLLSCGGTKKPFITKEQIDKVLLDLDNVFIHDLSTLMRYYLDSLYLQADKKSKRFQRLLISASDYGSLRIATLLAESYNFFNIPTEAALKSAALKANANVVELTGQGVADMKQSPIWRPKNFAAKSKDRWKSVESFQLFIQSGGKMFEPKKKTTALMTAAGLGLLVIVKYILNTVDKNEETKRYLEIDEYVLGIDQELPAKICYVNHQDRGGKTALDYATINDRDDVASYLIEQGAMSCSARTTERKELSVKFLSDSETERSVTAEGSTSARCSESFESREEDRSTFLCSAHKNTPLIQAATYGLRELVERILKVLDARTELSERDKIWYVNLRGVKYESALHRAVINDHSDIVSSLIRHGADTRRRHHGRTPLHFAVSKRNSNVVRALVDAVPGTERVGYLNAGNHDGNTAIHLAAEVGCLDSFKILHASGAAFTETNLAAETPLMLAAGNNRREMVAHILSCFGSAAEDTYRKAHVESNDRNGRTVLHHAALNNSVNVDTMKESGKETVVQIFRALLDALPEAERAEFVERADCEGKTALDWLGEDGLAEAVDVLVKAGARNATR